MIRQTLVSGTRETELDDEIPNMRFEGEGMVYIRISLCKACHCSAQRCKTGSRRLLGVTQQNHPADGNAQRGRDGGRQSFNNKGTESSSARTTNPQSLNRCRDASFSTQIASFVPQSCLCSNTSPSSPGFKCRCMWPIDPSCLKHS